MATYSIRMRRKNGSSWDTVYPITLAKNVKANNGMTMQEIVDTVSDKGNGSGSIAFYKHSTKIVNNTSVVPMGFEFDERTDTLLVFKNSVYIELDEDYRIGAEKDNIVIIGDELVASDDDPIYFNFVLLKAIPGKDAIVPGELIDDGSIDITKLSKELRDKIENKNVVTSKKNTIYIRSLSKVVPFSSDFIYDSKKDDIICYYNDEYIRLGVDYEIDEEGKRIVNLTGEWEGTDTEPSTLTFTIFINNKIAGESGSTSGSTPIEVIEQMRQLNNQIEELRKIVDNQQDFITNLF